MHSIVHIGDNQKVPGKDFRAFGELARDAANARHRHTAGEGLTWDDFTFSRNGLTLTVSDGYLYKNGVQHKTTAATPLALATLTPPSAGLKRVISIVAYGNPAKLEVPDRREFAVKVVAATGDAPATFQNETRETTTRNLMIASVGMVPGEIGPVAVAPLIAADQCEIARVVLLAGEIESITPVEATRTPKVAQVKATVEAHGRFIAGVGDRLNTIDKNLAGLSAGQATSPSVNQQAQLTANVALLNEITGAKPGDVDYGHELALDKRHTDEAFPGYAATVSAGIRFPWVATKEQPFALYTPGDNAVRIVSGLMLPDFDEVAGIVVTGKDGEGNISNTVHTVTTAVKRTVSRSSVSYGPAFTVCNNEAFWYTGNFNAAAGIFAREGEVFTAAPTGVDFGVPVGYAPGSHIEMRLQQMHTSSWTEEYWDYLSETFGIDGTIKGQTIKPPDFGYLTSIELPFTRKDTNFPVTLLVTETVNGLPSLKRVVEKVTLQPADIVADASGAVFTKFPLRPILCDPARSLGWLTVTKGNYALAKVDSNKYSGGSSVESTDQGEIFVASTTLDYAMKVNFARFKKNRVEVRMNDVDNAGGASISAIKYLYGSMLPGDSRIIHRLRKEGSAWSTAADVNRNRRPPDELTGGIFASNPLPKSVQQMLILIGSETLMPAVDLNQAWVTTLLLGTVRSHFSKPFTFKAPCDRAEVKEVVDGPFVPGQHTTGCRVIPTGGSPVEPSSVRFEDDPNKPGRRIYYYGFSFPTAAGMRVNLTGTLGSNLSAYHTDNRFWRSWKS